MDEGRVIVARIRALLKTWAALLVANKTLAWIVPCLGYSGGETAYTVSLRSMLGRVQFRLLTEGVETYPARLDWWKIDLIWKQGPYHVY